MEAAVLFRKTHQSKAPSGRRERIWPNRITLINNRKYDQICGLVSSSQGHHDFELEEEEGLRGLGLGGRGGDLREK